MKTHFIFLCLIVSGGVANATIQNKANPDKPPVIFVNQYSDQWTYDDGFYRLGANKYYEANPNYSGQISFNGHGAFYFHLGEGYGWWDTTYTWSDTNLSGTFSSSGYDQGGSPVDPHGAGHWDDFDPDCFSVPSTSWVNYSPDVKLSHFYANVSYSPQNPGDYMNFSLSAKTYMKLKTGGKAGVSRNNLFRINGSATGYGRPDYISVGGEPGDSWQNVPMSEIDPTRIRVLGKNLGNDGNLYTVLPDNATLDLAASAPGKHYSLNVSATKHKLYVQANSSILQLDHVVPKGTFSVGQKLTFSYFFNPPVDGIAATGTKYQWLLSGSIVNGWNSLGYGYDDYFFDTDLLKAPQTAAWHYSDAASKKATIDLDLQFSNGQRAKIAKVGLYTVVKPTVDWHQLGDCYGGFNVWSGGLFLSLGTSTETEDGEMSFGGTVISMFPGACSWMQLLNGQNESGFPVSAVSTEGQLNLDSSLVYPKSYMDLDLSASKNPILYSGIPIFTDCPRVIVGNNYSQFNSTFITYLRFKPSSPDAIWVTLGRVDCSWNAQASYNAQGQPILPINQLAGPNFTLSNQFPPMWYGIQDSFSILKNDLWYLLFGL